MSQVQLGQTPLSISRVVFGGNVFGWTLDEQQSFRILDAFVDHGFNTIDTADSYSAWVPGNSGGESETIIGRWLKARPGMRQKVVIFTKVGWDIGRPEEKGLSRRWIQDAAERSLRRLGIDSIDLYFAHCPDPAVPHEESLRAFGELIDSGKVKTIGASNYDASMLKAAREAADRLGLQPYQVLQPEYNLHDRSGFEGALRDISIQQGLGVVTYFSLASGFLSGKYRSPADLEGAQRGGAVGKYLTPRGLRILDALDEVAAAHQAKPSEIALAWLMAQPGVSAPIASATRVEHVESFARAAALRLSPSQLELLGTASGT